MGGSGGRTHFQGCVDEFIGFLDASVSMGSVNFHRGRRELEQLEEALDASKHRKFLSVGHPFVQTYVI